MDWVRIIAIYAGQQLFAAGAGEEGRGRGEAAPPFRQQEGKPHQQ